MLYLISFSPPTGGFIKRSRGHERAWLLDRALGEASYIESKHHLTDTLWLVKTEADVDAINTLLMPRIDDETDSAIHRTAQWSMHWQHRLRPLAVDQRRAVRLTPGRPIKDTFDHPFLNDLGRETMRFLHVPQKVSVDVRFRYLATRDTRTLVGRNWQQDRVSPLGAFTHRTARRFG